eukprot:jgi/Mesvir1/21908/Mv01970-RA.1
MAQRIQPQLDQTSTKQANLAVLQRQDPDIEDVLGTAAHVTLYSFDVNGMQWTRKNVEGSLFVVKRKSAPRFQFIVLNRLSTDNMVEDLLSGIEFELSPPYLLYRNVRKETSGIWFYDDAECEEVTALLKRISSAFSHALPSFQASPLGVVPAAVTSTPGAQKAAPRDPAIISASLATPVLQQRVAGDVQRVPGAGATPGAGTPNGSGAGFAKSRGTPGAQTGTQGGLTPSIQPQGPPGTAPGVTSSASASAAAGTSLLAGLLSIGRPSAGNSAVEGVGAMAAKAPSSLAPTVAGPDGALLPTPTLTSGSSNVGKTLQQMFGGKVNIQAIPQEQASVPAGPPLMIPPASGTAAGPPSARGTGPFAPPAYSGGPPLLPLPRGSVPDMAIASATQGAATPGDEGRGRGDGAVAPQTVGVAAPTDRAPLLAPNFLLADREGSSAPGGGSTPARPSLSTQGLPAWLVTAMGAAQPPQPQQDTGTGSTAAGAVSPVPVGCLVGSAPPLPPLPGPVGLFAGLQQGTAGAQASSRGGQAQSGGVSREQLKAAMLSLAKDDRFIDLLYQHLSLQ